MQKKILFILAFALMICCIQTSTISKAANSKITYLEDGYYLVTDDLQISSDLSGIVTYSTTTKNGSKTSRLYDADDQLIATFTVYGAFSINSGVSVECTKVTYSQTVSSSKYFIFVLKQYSSFYFHNHTHTAAHNSEMHTTKMYYFPQFHPFLQ